MPEKFCEVCGARFEKKVTESRAYWATKRMCSRRCIYAGRKPRSSQAIYLRDGRESRARIKCRDGTYVYFYRAVMEAELGRHLGPNEIVHHINGDCTDDRPENLEVTDRLTHVEIHMPMRHEWSRSHEYCVDCGGTDRPHAGGGRCRRCYQRAWQARSADPVTAT